MNLLLGFFAVSLLGALLYVMVNTEWSRRWRSSRADAHAEIEERLDQAFCDSRIVMTDKFYAATWHKPDWSCCPSKREVRTERDLGRPDDCAECGTDHDGIACLPQRKAGKVD